MGLAYVGGDQLAVEITLNTMAFSLGSLYGLWRISYGKLVRDMHMLFTCRFTWTLAQTRMYVHKTTGIFAVTAVFSRVLFLGTTGSVFLCVWKFQSVGARSKDHITPDADRTESGTMHAGGSTTSGINRTTNCCVVQMNGNQNFSLASGKFPCC